MKEVPALIPPGWFGRVSLGVGKVVDGAVLAAGFREIASDSG